MHVSVKWRRSSFNKIYLRILGLYIDKCIFFYENAVVQLSLLLFPSVLEFELTSLHHNEPFISTVHLGYDISCKSTLWWLNNNCCPISQQKKEQWDHWLNKSFWEMTWPCPCFRRYVATVVDKEPVATQLSRGLYEESRFIQTYTMQQWLQL